MATVKVEGYINFEPESRYLPDGEMVTSVQLSESYTNKGSGEKVYTRYQLQVYGQAAGEELIKQVTPKRVYEVEGFLILRAYVPADGGDPVAVGNIRPKSIKVVNRGGAAKEVEYSTA